MGIKHVSRKAHAVSSRILPFNTSRDSTREVMRGSTEVHPSLEMLPGALSTFKGSSQSPSVLGSWLLLYSVSGQQGTPGEVTKGQRPDPTTLEVFCGIQKRGLMGVSCPETPCWPLLATGRGWREYTSVLSSLSCVLMLAYSVMSSATFLVSSKAM